MPAAGSRPTLSAPSPGCAASNAMRPRVLPRAFMGASSAFRFRTDQMTSPTTSRIPTAEEFLRTDLGYICGNLMQEFSCMAGGRLLITGGAGFLGYYLV